MAHGPNIMNIYNSSSLVVTNVIPPQPKEKKDMKPKNHQGFPSISQKKNMKPTTFFNQPVAIGFGSWLNLLHSTQHLKKPTKERALKRKYHRNLLKQMEAILKIWGFRWKNDFPFQLGDLFWFQPLLLLLLLLPLFQGCKQRNLDTWDLD